MTIKFESSLKQRHHMQFSPPKLLMRSTKNTQNASSPLQHQLYKILFCKRFYVANCTGYLIYKTTCYLIYVITFGCCAACKNIIFLKFFFVGHLVHICVRNVSKHVTFSFFAIHTIFTLLICTHYIMTMPFDQ